VSDDGIDVTELLAAIDAGERLLLLDVRNERDFAAWRIGGRREPDALNVPYFRFLEEADAIVPRLPRGVPLVTVCAHGGSSALVSALLREHGIVARNLVGGMAAYGAHLSPVRVPTPVAERRFEIWQVQRVARGCLSYVVVSGGAAVVVDPSRHVERYEAFVAARNARIELVIDTHVHADHVSGGATLAARNRAAYFVGVADGWPIGGAVAALPAGGSFWLRRDDAPPLELRMIATPGHTPEGHAVLVAGRWLLSGDTLLVDGVGRPDLGAHALEWGRDLYRTITQRLAWLPDETVVLPAHTAAPPDVGAHDVIATSLGEVRGLPELTLPSADTFARAIAALVGPAPEAYAQIVVRNRDPEPIPPELADEWELGPNQCAARPGAAAAPETR
jgi:glyoxylase-like metal-dependent hydrolase (beta-lactamase superfamily II)/rhodanese-related sulfurtransferase